jgi:diadenosine tetraphosphate (Ap4A) HIT family hydrolase
MSPTVFRAKGYRFFFFSREETRMHIHVHSGNGEAKFWMEPGIQIAQNHGLSMTELNEAHRLIEEHENEIRKSWEEHFTG